MPWNCGQSVRIGIGQSIIWNEMMDKRFMVSMKDMNTAHPLCSYDCTAKSSCAKPGGICFGNTMALPPPKNRLIRIDNCTGQRLNDDFGSWARGNENPSIQKLTGRETMAGPPTVKALAPAAREKRVATAEARMVGFLDC